ncbi:MAG: GNAT family N-acetyltransferase [Rhodobacteraceae bacterium]|nr:GNAT family N-acetyltransferase [Paracoccaceae bacterium]
MREGVNGFFADYALTNFTKETFEVILSDKNETISVSQNRVGIDGFIRLTNGSNAPISGCSEFELTTLYVQGQHHGKGIGAALLNTCKGLKPWLAVNAENTQAIHFYQKHGFSIIGDTYFDISGQQYLNRVMA